MNHLIIAVMLAALIGCASTTPLTAVSDPARVVGFATLASWGTFEMQLAPAYTRLAAARHRAASAVRRGEISASAARSVQADADRARALLDDAHRAASDGVPTPPAQEYLGQALEIIDHIERGIAK